MTLESIYKAGYKIGRETKIEETDDGYKITATPKLEKFLPPNQGE